MTDRKYPDKLHFLNKWGEGKFTLHHDRETDMGDVWRCTFFKEEPRGYEASYTARFIEGRFASGEWIRIDEDGNEIRPLNYPFVVENTATGIQYEITKGSKPEMSAIRELHNEPAARDNAYHENSVREFIQFGIWRVIHIGDASADVKPVEAPTSDESPQSTLSLKIDTKDAQNSIKGLVELLGIAVERAVELEAVMKRLNGRE